MKAFEFDHQLIDSYEDSQDPSAQYALGIFGMRSNGNTMPGGFGQMPFCH